MFYPSRILSGNLYSFEYLGKKSKYKIEVSLSLISTYSPVEVE